jgi:hypothetical protein
VFIGAGLCRCRYTILCRGFITDTARKAIVLARAADAKESARAAHANPDFFKQLLRGVMRPIRPDFSLSCGASVVRTLAHQHASCIIPSGARATSSEFCQKRKIPPPSSLDGRVGRRSPSGARNTLACCKRNVRNARAVGLPSPRNPAKKLIEKQRALVVLFANDRVVSNRSACVKRARRACGRFGLGLKSVQFGDSDCRR